MVDIKLYQRDCLELMKDIPDGSVDMILTDPPYGTTACKWDSVIPFEPMWEHLERIIKPNGAICFFGSEPFSSALRMSNIKKYKYDWVWRKNRPTGFQHAKNMPLKEHENIMVFSLGSMGHEKLLGNKRLKYNPQGIESCYFVNHSSANRFGNVVGKRPSQKEYTVQTETNYPKTILEFPKDDKNKLHPTQKPVALLEYLIRTYTREGETVLDFTAGSMSTVIACINTNRSCIAIEKDENYFNIGCDRVKKHILENRSEMCCNQVYGGEVVWRNSKTE